jgi:two-component system sensor histidine kinase YesM
MISKSWPTLKFKNSRLTTKLMITYVLLTVVPMALLGYIAYYQYTKSIEQQAGEYIPRLLMQANKNIENEMNELENLPELIYSSEDVMTVLRDDTYKSQSALLQDQFVVKNFLSRTYVSSNHSEILGVFLLSKNRVFTTSRTSYQGFNFENVSLPYGEDLDLGGDLHLLLPHQVDLEFNGNPPYLLLMKQIKDFDNRKNLGTLLLAVKVTFIEKVLHDLKQEKNVDMWMMNEYGQVIYHTDSSKIGTVFNKINEYPLLNGSFRTETEGERTLISVSETKNLNWVLVHSIPLKYLTERTDVIRNVTIFFFILFSVITTVISIFFAWNVTRPITTLGQIMKEVEKGNFQVEIPIHSKDEVGMLARSFRSMITKIRELIQKNYHIEIRQKNAELYALQSQINPHFMYNTLETIGMAVEEEESEIVVDMVTLLGRMLRFSLSNKDRLVPISSEVQHIHDYLGIQKFRFEDRLSFHVQEAAAVSSYFTPKFVLQPIVENAIKYGLEKRKGLTIDINIIKERNESGQGDLLLVIRDNGPGIHEETLAKLNRMLESDPMARRDSGFGIINVHARVVMMFGSNYGLQIRSIVDEGTEVIIRIPMIDESQAAQYANNKGEMGDDDND